MTAQYECALLKIYTTTLCTSPSKNCIHPIVPYFEAATAITTAAEDSLKFAKECLLHVLGQGQGSVTKHDSPGHRPLADLPHYRSSLGAKPCPAVGHWTWASRNYNPARWCRLNVYRLLAETNRRYTHVRMHLYSGIRFLGGATQRKRKRPSSTSWARQQLSCPSPC